MTEFERAKKFIEEYPWDFVKGFIYPPYLEALTEKLDMKTITKKKKLKKNPELLKDRREWPTKGYLGKNLTKTS